MGLVAICPPFLLNTPPYLFFGDSFFHKVIETYEFRNDTCFLFVRLRNLTDHIITPFLAFDFQNVAEFHVLPNDGC